MCVGHRCVLPGWQQLAPIVRCMVVYCSVDTSEMMSHPEFDIDSDGTVSEEEAKVWSCVLVQLGWDLPTSPYGMSYVV